MLKRIAPSTYGDRKPWRAGATGAAGALVRRCLVVLGIAVAVAVVVQSTPAPAGSGTTPPDAPVRISGSGNALPLVRKLAESYALERPQARFQVQEGTNSGGAIRGVVHRTLDVAVIDRPLTANEAEQAIEYRSFARDSVVFATNLSEPLEGLTIKQVREIYGGTLTNWQQVGLMSAPIMVLDRDEDEPARHYVMLPLLNGEPVLARTITLATPRDMVDALASTPDALGYTSPGLLRLLKPRNVRILRLDGVGPEPPTGQGQHLTLSLIHRRDAAPSIRRFADFILASEGRAVLEAYGYAMPLE
ncbi:MAG: substrate-binding domain-containing protein [Chloroflexi bacterium]|nr:substrate-binding domain-containing protein [Chloroflexota bacterium]